MTYPKLVRDRMPEIIQQKGHTPVTHVASEEEYDEMLVKKLHEEVAEFLVKVSIDDAADILEVLHALCARHGISLADIETVRQKRRVERGGFEGKIILERTDA